jgi:hypothetical protein
VFFSTFLFSLVIALIFTLVFGIKYRRLGPWVRVETFFVILFLSTWALGLLITPFGPVSYGVYWLPFLLIGLIIALLLASPRPAPLKSEEEAAREAKGQAEVENTVNAFFWALVVILVITIIFWYIWMRPAV